MNLKKNNGFAGVDISISMIIILIFIPTIFGVVYNVQKTNNSIKRQTTAINLATQVLEIAKSEQYQNVTVENADFLAKLNTRYIKSTYTNTETEDSSYEYIYYQAIGQNEEHYQIQIGIKNYYPEGIEEANKQDIIKQIQIRVFYPIGNNLKNIDISTILQNT